MRKLLTQNQIERLKERFRNEPLLKACQQTYRRYEESLEVLLVSPEDIFCLSVEVLDNILSYRDITQEYIDEIKSDIIVGIRRNWMSDAPPKEREMIANAALYVVAITMGFHWHSKYCYGIKEMLLHAIQGKQSFNGKEEKQIIYDIVKQAEGLDDWINNYADNVDYLSDEIEEFLDSKNQTAFSVHKKGREIVVECEKAFVYNNKNSETRNAQLILLYKELKNNHWIASSTDQKEFVNLFLGGISQYKVAWKGKKNMLRYLFKQWIDEKQWLKTPQGFGKWQMVCAHFYLIDKDQNELRIKEDELKNCSNPTESRMDDAQKVIELLNPELNITQAFRDIEE